ncbi:leucine-rich repeat-containing protein 59 [Megalopta genalis]|uniref:leucine-rich repeat-containing protein 59 n=1 Tax=Megalopta genalis TaxID=115081 RepID=UPI00144329B3|nr:leucine-rich repeat-containing protein 59 [Megalopta genalis]XP_033331117.1 leucine-rich repeat-containing protein 59 [Megalopta genalis]
MNLRNIKDKLKDETLDLSLCDLKEVPVREIATVKKATHLDLSNNLLVSLPNTFVTLKQIIKLDLSRNMLTEIPENFGELKQLRHLDLYANQISRLPLSLSELKNLRWLDLKENPLTPAVASIAGPCSNLSECQACARNVVMYLSSVKLKIEEEKLRRLNAVTSTENDSLLPKKVGKKKKKKLAGKENRESLDKSRHRSSSNEFQIETNKIELPAMIENDLYADKKPATKGKSTVVRLFLLSFIIAILTIVVLPMYSEQCDALVNYAERNTGIPLKAFQEQSIDMYRSSVRTAINWTESIYKDLYHVYENSFRGDVGDLPSK